jgi:BirA family biotin operon repressor/biotin-[acetyl-CoA-carboxylase] ligase
LLDDRKICGILVESPAAGDPSAERRYVVGVGVNVNNCSATAPPELTGKVISVRDVTGHPVDAGELLIGVLDLIALLRQQHCSGTLDLPTLWREFCVLSGRQVVVQGGNRLVGTCQGIDTDGALRLDTADGMRRCFTGSIARIE